jgi:hypothetical protein
MRVRCCGRQRPGFLIGIASVLSRSVSQGGLRVLPHFFFLTVSVRVKPKSAGALQRLDASRSAGQAASRFQRRFGSFPVGVFVGRHHDCDTHIRVAIPSLRICRSPDQSSIQSH